MLVLGIETSCDETAVAIVRDGKEVIASVVASQIALHEKWGGVIPEIAAREHLTSLNHVFDEALEQAKVAMNDIDAIAVTQGPGLVGCLLIGSTFAKGLAQVRNLPLIPVNHVHAHVHGAFLGISTPIEELCPCIALVASGGHTNLYYIDSPVEFELLAHTMDDACGESFDKVGKMLGLPYPGGPHVETLARSGEASKVAMPRMLERRQQMAFSYSGLKTAVSLAIRSRPNNITDQDIAASFQEAALDQLARKIEQAIVMRPNARSVIISGGVAANTRLKTLLNERISLATFFPPLAFCGDNGAMIAALGYHMHKDDKKYFDYSWDVFSRYPFELYTKKATQEVQT
jgi:N6-L-threonylcarbamoyladenine synthase